MFVRYITESGSAEGRERGKHYRVRQLPEYSSLTPAQAILRFPTPAQNVTIVHAASPISDIERKALSGLLVTRRDLEMGLWLVGDFHGAQTGNYCRLRNELGILAHGADDR